METDATIEAPRIPASEMGRLLELIRAAATFDKPRHATRPTLASKKRRLESKLKRGVIKKGRQPVQPD